MVKRNRKRKNRQERKEVSARRLRRSLMGSVWIAGLSIIGVGLGVGAYQLACFLNTSPAFSVRQVQVRGNHRTNMDELLHAVGIQKGTNVFSLNLTQIRKSLLELPWIKQAISTRVVPDKIVIEVEEYDPVALINLGAIYYVSARGEVFKRVQPGEMVDLPVLTGLSRDEFNQDPVGVRMQVMAYLRMLEKMRSLSCLGQYSVAEINLDELMGITVVFDPGAVSVRFAGGDLDTRMRTLCRVWDRLADRKLKPRTILLDHRRKPTWATVRLDDLARGNHDRA